jgi:hypothetical protein
MLSKEFKQKEKIEDNDIKSLFFAFLNRARFKYTFGHIFDYIFKCLCFRDLGDLRRERNYKEHFLFEKAEEKFM